MNTFTEEELHDIYRKYVNLPETYFQKNIKLGPCPVKSWNYSWSGKDFPRNWCILDFREWIQKHNLESINTLGYTCDSDPELEFIKPKQKILVEYPTFDLHTIDKNFNNIFDFFIFNQTLEHLYNPFMAVKSIYNTIKKGGYVFTSVPTINIPHSTPIHYNGFNPMGLALLFKSVGFEIIEIGQWGNYDYISKLWKTHSWPSYDDLEKDGCISNERNNVTQCWILVKKI